MNASKTCGSIVSVLAIPGGCASSRPRNALIPSPAVQVRPGKWLQMVIAILALVPLCGCRSTTLRSDQTEIRQAVIDLNQDQVLDNLIRARLRLPLVQIAYSNLSGSITTTAKANSTLAREDTNNRIAVPGSTASDVVKNTVNGFLEGQWQAVLNLKGDPVYDTSVYALYHDHASMLKENPTKPERAMVHGGLVKEFDGTWYFVPPEAKDEFWDLYVATTVAKAPKAGLLNLDEVQNLLQQLRSNQNL